MAYRMHQRVSRENRWRCLAANGGFTWDQVMEYLSRSNHIDFFPEALNDAVFPEQIFAGRDEDEILDYKFAYFSCLKTLREYD
ncbi:MAG: hypothetical protein IPL92_18070 [Saprospiraceae bacterium]|nr:hypothetical protein [Candidatus Opimibacter iunctus]